MRTDAALALLFALAASAAQAQTLGTLFHTAEERARLERLRRGEAEASHHAGPARPEVTGFVRRSDGSGTVWINGVPVAVKGGKGEALLDPEAVRLGDADAVRIERVQPGEVKR